MPITDLFVRSQGSASAAIARVIRRVAPAFLLLSCLVAMPGCQEINQILKGVGGTGAVNALTPTVSAQPLRLVRTPTLVQLGAYFCPQVISDPIARLGCSVVLGSPPPRTALVFEFGTTVTVNNPNNIPVPALDVLLALKLFNGQPGQESLGSICLSMCGSQDPSCTGAPKPGACTSNQRTIKTVNDFVAAVPGLIAGLANAALTGELRKSNIAARGNVQLNLTFALGIDQALRVFQKVIVQIVESQLKKGQPELAVPVSGEGTVFVQLPGSGRIGVGFGPLITVWKII
jgi:hypothetical protein